MAACSGTSFSTQTTAVNTGSLAPNSRTRGVTTPDVVFFKHVGGVLHWDVITPGSDILLAASTDAVGGLLNLSHVCDGGGGGGGGGTSSVTTTVHPWCDRQRHADGRRRQSQPRGSREQRARLGAVTFVGVNARRFLRAAPGLRVLPQQHVCRPGNPADQWASTSVARVRRRARPGARRRAAGCRRVFVPRCLDQR